MNLSVKKLSIKFAIAALPLMVASMAAAPAHAVQYIFEDINLNGRKRAGNFDHIQTIFDTDTNRLTWSSTLSRNSTSGNLANGAWLVLSDGENPKSNVDEYAIFYMDAVNEKVTVYNYDGVNSADSYRHEDFLDSFALTVTDNGPDERTFSFDYDASTINGLTNVYGNEWDGAAFGEKIGIWYHTAADLNATYRADGSLDNFSFTGNLQGWHDSANNETKRVPEPGSLFALGFLAVTAGTQLRKRFS